MYTISSNGFSVDQQIDDAVSNLTEDERKAFDAAFPEYNGLTWLGSWIDAETSGVDVDYMNWVVEWIEANTSIFWADGEPWRGEEGDSEEDAD